MKAYKINNKIVRVKEKSIAHRVIEHGTPFLVLGTTITTIAVLYGISLIWYIALQ